MNIIEIIEKKKHGEALNNDEIKYFIDGMLDGSIEKYQTSSLLMAILLKDMDREETFNLTKAMVESGDEVDLSSIDGIKCDKHSTGGVGDKVSLALIPLVSSLGVKMAKMSGKGLGHTGGTLDKLESIPGFNISLSEEEYIDAINTYGEAIISQTGNLAPADKELYALRDVTGTIDSIPLIASSIMSKKLASGADTILLDVKTGSGAFMSEVEGAKELARIMVDIGNDYGRDTKAVVSNMDEPLGYAVGNSLELIEAIETLKGNGPDDFNKLILELGSIILDQSKIESDRDKAKEMLWENMTNGKGLEKLKDLIKAQGGNPEVVDNIALLPLASRMSFINSESSGYISGINALEIGILSRDLGAGRKIAGEKIDHSVGIILNKKTGDYVEEGEVLATIYHSKDLEDSFISRFIDAYSFSDDKVAEKTIVYEYIK